MKTRHIYRYFFILLFFLLKWHAPLAAQTVIGPYEVYVSEQRPTNQILSQQSAQGSADEGRVLNIRVTDIKGPIIVSPAEYNLNGPPCPTYTPNGQRIPTNPLPANTSNFSGSVTLNNAQIPSAGTTKEASFKIKDYGYWTVCSRQEKKYFPDEYLVKYNINSIKLVLESSGFSCCKGSTGRLNVKSIYPAGAGTVSWSSSGSNLSVSGDNTGANITGNDYGDGVITATLTVGQATYKVDVNVKVGDLKFDLSIKDLLWYKNGTLDAKTLLTANSIKENLKWTISNNDKAATIDENTGIITYPAEGGATYTVKVESKVNPKCNAEITLRLMSLFISFDMDKGTVCDGAPAFFKLKSFPDVGASFLQGFSYTMHADPKVEPKGNPGGTTTLEFSNMATPSMTFSVKHSWWYSTGGDDCNDVAYYNIYVTTTVNGTEVKAEPKLLGASTDYDDCLYGRTFIDTGFTGLPFFHLKKLPNGKFGCTLTDGDFRRKLEIRIVIKTDPSSQFKQMTIDEENYHKNQFLGKNSTIINDLFDDEKVMGPLRTQVFEGDTKLKASQAAMAAFRASLKAEDNRTWIEFKKRKCDIEKEAKTGISATYRGKLECAYPKCVGK